MTVEEAKQWGTLNPKVNAERMLKMIDKNNGMCICSGNTSVDKRCPCSNFRELGYCECKLFVNKVEEL